MTAWHPSHTHQLCFSPPHCCNLEPLWSDLLVAITLLLMPGLSWTYLALAACRVYHPVKYRSPSLIVISLTWLEAENPSYFVSTLFISPSLFEVADFYWLSVVSGHHIVSLLLCCRFFFPIQKRIRDLGSEHILCLECETSSTGLVSKHSKTQTVVVNFIS